MADSIHDYLFFKRNRLLADLITNAPGAKFILHLGDGDIDEEILVKEDDCLEIADSHYTPLEITEWEVFEQDDGLVLLRKLNIEFDLGDGPDEDIEVSWIWVEFEADDYPRRKIGAFELPVPFPFTAETPSFKFHFEWEIGWVDENVIIPDDVDDV